MVQQQKLDYVRISFMIAGHTKFSHDLLFAKVSQAFTRSDVFSTTELAEIASRYSTVVIDKGDVVQQWRTNLAKIFQIFGNQRKAHLLSCEVFSVRKGVG